MGKLSGGGWITMLPDDVRGLVRGNMSSRDLVDGEQLFGQGDQADALYEVVEGQLIVSHHSVDGVESIIAVFTAQDCVGEQSIVGSQPRANSAFARGRTKVMVLGKQAFDRLRSEHPEITEAFLQLITMRFRQVLVRLAEPGSISLHERLVRRIASLAESVSGERSNVVELNLRFSQSEFARWVGSTRQRVNGALGDLQKSGLITVSMNRIRIDDLAGLRSYGRRRRGQA